MTTRRTLPTLFICGTLLLGGSLWGVPNDDSEARRTALAVAGAFSNEGFKLRDGNWTGAIQPKGNLLVQVHLYAGNQYWFTVGASRQARKLALSVFDETGALMKSEPYQDPGKAAEGSGPTAAAGFAASVSGAYFVRIQEMEGGSATFSFVYSYK